MKRKAIKAIIFSIAAVLALLAAVGFIFQDKIIELTVQSFRKNIRSKVIIGDAQFSLIKNFPYASVRLSDVVIMSTKDIDKKQFARYIKPDTLLKASSLNLKMNVVDLFRDRVTIKQVALKNADLKLLIDHEGHNNFSIIKKTGQKSSDMSLSIRGVELRNTKLYLYDLEKRMALVNKFEHLQTTGNFSLEQFKVKTKARVLVEKLAVGDINYVNGKWFDIEGKVRSTAFKKFEFEDFNIYYKTANKLNINGGFALSKNFSVDIAVAGTDLVLGDINELVPKVNSTLEKINFEGTARVSAKAEGVWTKTKSPFLFGNFEVKGGKSEILTSNSIASVNLVGEFSNGRGSVENAFVRIASYTVNSNFGDFEGKFILTNFKRPIISLSSNFNLFLQKLNKAYRIDSSNVIDGTVIGNITANGRIDFDSLSPLKLIRLVNNGSFKLSEVTLPVARERIGIVKGELTFNPDVARASLNFASAPLKGRVSVVINNFYDGVMEAKPIVASVEGNLASIDFDKLLAMSFPTSRSKSKASMDINVMHLCLNVSSKEAVVRKIRLSNLSANINKLGSNIEIVELKGHTFGGGVDLSGAIDQNPNKTSSASLLVSADSIDIQDLFRSFNNFGQKALTDKNIKGRASSNIAFKGTFTDKGVLLPKSVECVADMTINNGELLKFEPAYKLSRFIELSELEDIRFSSLKNKITISNGTVMIPAMYIGSSAINLGLMGTHNLDGNYSYRIRLALKDVLFKKAKKKLKREVSQSEFENNMLLYFRIEGNQNSSKVSYDWNGKDWDLPQIPGGTSVAPKPEQAPSSAEKSEKRPAEAAPTKGFKVEWEGEQVAPRNSQPVAKPAAKPAPKPAKAKSDSAKFKVVWEDE